MRYAMILEWISDKWTAIAVPLVVFLAFVVVSIWARRRLYSYLERVFSLTKWEGSDIFLNTTRTSCFQWCLILGGYTAIQISELSPYLKSLSGRLFFGSIFIVSLTWTIITLIEQLLRLYLKRVQALPVTTTAFVVNGVKIAFVVACILILLDLWGMPTTPLMLILTIGSLIAIFASRNEILNIFAGIEIGRSNLVKTGDYVKLESGEEGYVSKITWNNIQMKTPDEKILLIPNSKFIGTTVTILGKPLKQASQPFRFYAQLHLKELTGLKAKNLSELTATLKDVDDSVVYYHTHNFIEEYQYLTPQPANDFALWVSDALGDEVLGEKLANIDTFEFSTIGALRERLVDVLNEALSIRPDGNGVPPGREFHFIKSLSVIIPTFYVAHDLREFIEVLRMTSIDTLYFHIFEARLRLHKGVNDFSIWLNDCLGEKELADKIAVLDPYTYSFEGLRSMIIQLAEKHVEKEHSVG
jgi:small-conductance mechanosensitive channel